MSSIVFVMFTAVLFPVYFIGARLAKIPKWAALLAASAIFYALGLSDARYFIFIFTTALVIYAAAVLNDDNSFWFALLLIFGTLLIFKTNLFTIPLGVSYYTFSAASYLIDVRRGIIKAERNFFKLFLFVIFFPSITMGPINRYKELDLFSGRSFDQREFTRGAVRILWGLFKKMVIADNLAVYVNEVFGRVSAGEPTRGVYLFFGAAAFGFQLYADFSGYMDMVIGAAAALGIKMTENFNAPFFSRSIAEFWRRWHITLGAWLRDYVLYPLQRAFIKKGKTKLQKSLINFSCMFVTWFLIGYWHGASWSFIIGTGLLHWFYMVVETLRPPRKFFAPLEILRTFLLVCFGFIFFRSDDVLMALRYIKEMFTGTVGDLEIFEAPRLVMIICAVLVLMLCEGFGFKIERQKTVVRWGIYIALILSVVIFGAYGIGYNESGFIYSNF